MMLQLGVCNGDVGASQAKTGTIIVTDDEKELAQALVDHKTSACQCNFNGVGYIVNQSPCNHANGEQPVMDIEQKMKKAKGIEEGKSDRVLERDV